MALTLDTIITCAGKLKLIRIIAIGFQFKSPLLANESRVEKGNLPSERGIVDAAVLPIFLQVRKSRSDGVDPFEGALFGDIVKS